MPVFLVLIISRYTKIPRIDEIGHNLICKEKSLDRTNLCLSFYGGFCVIAFQVLLGRDGAEPYSKGISMC